MTVKKGTTITWINKDIAKHTVTSEDNQINSPRFGQGEKFTFQFTKTGMFSYFCQPHPYMKGSIEVTE